MRVLGIDTGSTHLAWAVVAPAEGPTPAVLLAHGAVEGKPHTPLAYRLWAAGQELGQVARAHQVSHVGYELVFQHARRGGGAMDAALFTGAVLAALALYEPEGYTPNQVKAVAVGHGGADKKQVAAHVRELVGVPAGLRLSAHVTDAIGVALCRLAQERPLDLLPLVAAARTR